MDLQTEIRAYQSFLRWLEFQDMFLHSAIISRRVGSSEKASMISYIVIWMDELKRTITGQK